MAPRTSRPGAGRPRAGSGPPPARRRAAPVPPTPGASRPTSRHPELPFTARGLPQGPGMLRFTPDSAGIAAIPEEHGNPGVYGDLKLEGYSFEENTVHEILIEVCA